MDENHQLTVAGDCPAHFTLRCRTMSQQRNHRISDWLYHTTFFTRLYGSVAGRFAMEVLWDEFQTNFLSQIPDGGTLLEVGAGPGLLALQILENYPSLNIIVTDYSSHMIDLAKANLEKVASDNSDIAKRKNQLEYVQANAMDLSEFCDHKIDGIYSMGAVKHFPEPVNCLHQARKILAGGGIMYFADACSDGTFSGTSAIAAKLNLSPVARSLLTPIIHAALKRESPPASEVKSWCTDFGNGSELDVRFSLGGSMFTLMYQKS